MPPPGVHNSASSSSSGGFSRSETGSQWLRAGFDAAAACAWRPLLRRQCRRALSGSASPSLPLYLPSRGSILPLCVISVCDGWRPAHAHPLLVFIPIFVSNCFSGVSDAFLPVVSLLHSAFSMFRSSGVNSLRHDMSCRLPVLAALSM